MSDDGRTPSKLEIVAHHEAGHAVVSETLGVPFKYVRLWRQKKRVDLDVYEIAAKLQEMPYNPEQLWYKKLENEWEGEAPSDDRSSDINLLWPVIFLVPDDEYKDVRITCTIKFAGLVVEKLMGIDEKIIWKGCHYDIENARGLIEPRFPPEEQIQELLDAESRAMNILSNIVYWNRVQTIASGMISAVLQGSPTSSDEYKDEYLFSRDEIMRFVNSH